MEIKANLNYLHIAPRKARLVADLIRGRSVREAENELRHLTKRSANPLLKLLRSAMANAKHNFNLDQSGLYVKDIRVDPGPVLKRFQPRAFGRASPLRRRSSHVALILGLSEAMPELVKKSRKERPLLREATEDLLKEREEAPKGKERREETIRPPKPRAADFVRRIFRRKAM